MSAWPETCPFASLLLTIRAACRRTNCQAKSASTICRLFGWQSRQREQPAKCCQSCDDLPECATPVVRSPVTRTASPATTRTHRDGSGFDNLCLLHVHFSDEHMDVGLAAGLYVDAELGAQVDDFGQGVTTVNPTACSGTLAAKRPRFSRIRLAEMTSTAAGPSTTTRTPLSNVNSALPAAISSWLLLDRTPDLRPGRLPATFMGRGEPGEPPMDSNRFELGARVHSNQSRRHGVAPQAPSTLRNSWTADWPCRSLKPAESKRGHNPTASFAQDSSKARPVSGVTSMVIDRNRRDGVVERGSCAGQFLPRRGTIDIGRRLV